MSYAKSKFSASTDTSHSESSRTNPENSIHSETQSRKPILQSVSSEHTSSAQILSGSDHDASADIHTKKYPKDTTQDIGDNNTSEFNIQSNDKVINNVSPQKYTIPDASLTHNSTTDSIPNKNKQSTTNEIKYSLSRGVITLLDGSNSEFRTCEDCHRRRNGSELCRFVRLHSGPNWDDNRVPPQRISLPQGMVFKRIGGNNETVIRPFIAQNQKAVSGQNRITQPTNTMTMQAVVHPITSLASKFQLAGRRFRELPRPPCEEEEKPIDQLIRLEARVNEMQANVDFLLSRTHVRIPSTHSVLKDGTNNSDTTVYNMSQFFAALKDKIATAKMNRQPVKDIMLFAEMEILRFRQLVNPAALQVSNDVQLSSSTTLESLLASLYPKTVDSANSEPKYSSSSSGQPVLLPHDMTPPVVTEEASMLTSVLRPVDAKLRACSQFQEASETVRYGLHRSTSRVNTYGEFLESLKLRLAGVQKQFDTHEVVRNEHTTVAGKEISELQEEERRLVDMLSKVRQSLSVAKRQHSGVIEEDNQQRFREKVKIYRTTKDLELCSSLLSRSEQSRNIYTQFNDFLRYILTQDSLFATGTSIASTASATASSANDKAPILKGKQSKVSSATAADSRSAHLQRDWKSTVDRISQWLKNSMKSSQSHSGDASEIVLDMRSRVIYEGLRIAHSLLAQCYKELDSTRPSPQIAAPSSVVTSHTASGNDDKMDLCEAGQVADSMSFSHPVMIPITIDSEWVNSGFKNLGKSLSKTDPYETVSRPSTSSINQVNSQSTWTTLVLCDPRNLGHLTSKASAERSYRIVRIMDNLVRLQKSQKVTSSAEVNIDKGSSVDNTHTPAASESVSLAVRSLSCMYVDESSDLPTGFWESLTLAHSEEYLQFLWDQCAALQSTTANTSMNDKHAATTNLVSLVKESGFEVDDDESYVFDSNDEDEEDDESLQLGEMDTDFFSQEELGGKKVHRSAAAGSKIGLPKLALEALNSYRPDESDPLPSNWRPSDKDRVLLYDTMRSRRVGGNAAPFLRNLSESLMRNTHFTIYIYQDGKNDDVNPEHKRILQYLQLMVASKLGSSSMSQHTRGFSFEPSHHDSALCGVNSRSQRRRIDSVDDYNDNDVPANTSARASAQSTYVTTLSVKEENTNPNIDPATTAAEVAIITMLRRLPESTISVISEFAPPATILPSVWKDYSPSQLHRVEVYDPVQNRRFTSNNAPFLMNLHTNLMKHPQNTIFTFQDRPVTACQQVSILMYLKSKITENNITGRKREPLNRSSVDAPEKVLPALKRKVSDNLNGTPGTSHIVKQLKIETQGMNSPNRVRSNNRVRTPTLASAATKGESKASLSWARPGGNFFVELGDDLVISGPGHWEDLESGLCDTCISAQSLEAALAAAAIVCRAVNAVQTGRSEGFRAETSILEVAPMSAASTDNLTETLPGTCSSNQVESKAIKSEAVAVEESNDKSDNQSDDDSDESESESSSGMSLQSFDSTILRQPNPRISRTQATRVSASNQMIVDDDDDDDENRNQSVGNNVAASTAVSNSVDLAHGESWARYYDALLTVCENSGSGNLLFKHTEQFEDGSTAKLGRWISDQRSIRRKGTMNQDRFQMLQWLVDGGLIAWEMTGNAWINGPNTLGLSIHEICEQARAKMKAYVSKVGSNDLHRSSVNNFRSSRMNNSDTDSDESEGSKCLDALNDAILHAPAKPLTVENIKNVFCCIRPPGHHAGRYGSTRGCTQNGFCLLNNIIIGAYYARIKYGHRKFAVIDIDAHFGNGTAEILEGDPHAFYASIHLQSESPTNPFFPSSPCCLLGEDCDEPNRVFVNVFPSEVPRALNVFARNRLRGREGFREAFITRVIPRLKAFQPDFIFISSGFDGSSTDPVGGQLGLLPQDFHAMVQELRVCAENMCGGRLVSVLEGGYDVSSRTNGLAVAAEAHVKALMCLPL